MTITPISTHLTILQVYETISPGLFVFNLDEELSGNLSTKAQWTYMSSPYQNSLIGAAGENYIASSKWNENYLVSNGMSEVKTFLLGLEQSAANLREGLTNQVGLSSLTKSLMNCNDCVYTSVEANDRWMAAVFSRYQDKSHKQWVRIFDLDLPSDRNLYAEYALQWQGKTWDNANRVGAGFYKNKPSTYVIKMESCYDVVLDKRTRPNGLKPSCEEDLNTIHLLNDKNWIVLKLDEPAKGKVKEYLPSYLADENSKVRYIDVTLSNLEELPTRKTLKSKVVVTASQMKTDQEASKEIEIQLVNSMDFGIQVDQAAINQLEFFQEEEFEALLKVPYTVTIPMTAVTGHDFTIKAIVNEEEIESSNVCVPATQEEELCIENTIYTKDETVTTESFISQASFKNVTIALLHSGTDLRVCTWASNNQTCNDHPISGAKCDQMSM